jgi:hypothetical protein
MSVRRVCNSSYHFVTVFMSIVMTAYGQSASSFELLRIPVRPLDPAVSHDVAPEVAKTWNRLVAGVRRNEVLFSKAELSATVALLHQVQGGLIALGFAASDEFKALKGDDANDQLRQLHPNVTAFAKFLARKAAEHPDRLQFRDMHRTAARLAVQIRGLAPLSAVAR